MGRSLPWAYGRTIAVNKIKIELVLRAVCKGTDEVRLIVVLMLSAPPRPEKGDNTNPKTTILRQTKSSFEEQTL